MPTLPNVRNTVEDFLQRLQDVGPIGAVAIVNMLDSSSPCAELGGGSLITPGDLRSFLLDCVQTEQISGIAQPDPLTTLDRVSRGQGAGGHAYLRLCRQSPDTSKSDEHLSNVMTTVNFVNHIVDRTGNNQRNFPVVLPAFPANTPRDIADYRDRLSELTSEADWFKSNATLGRPLWEPYNCWLTSNRFPVDPAPPPYPSISEGTKARDELGLIGCRSTDCLLRLSFPASVLASLTNVEIARPTFADGGNTHFRVYQASARARTFAGEGWGATQHLKKLATANATDVTGVCERVARSLPVANLTGLNVELLGYVIERRGITAGVDDLEAVANRVLAGRTADAARSLLLDLVM